MGYIMDGSHIARNQVNKSIGGNENHLDIFWGSILMVKSDQKKHLEGERH